MNPLRRLPPLVAMLGALVICAVAGLSAARFAAVQPFLGWPLTVDAGEVVLAVSGPVRTRLLSIAPGGRAGDVLDLEASDLTEDPDAFDSYEALSGFYARQRQLYDMLSGGSVVVRLQEDGAATVREQVVAVTPRGLSGLPFAFWQQLAIGAAAAMIAAWIWSLRPTDLSACLFGLTGLCMAGFTFPAAIYSTRELALDAATFRGLSILNAIGATGFGAAMIALFLVYPQRLVRRAALLLVLPALLYAWMASGTLGLLPSPQLGGPTVTTVEMLGILVAIGIQWWRTRRDVRARAGLRWLGLAVGLGAGAFILLSVAPKLLDMPPVLSQGSGFIFFLLIYAGVALGLRRYRLFELNDWAFGILFFLGGLVLLMALDAVLVFAFSFAPIWSLGIALTVTTFAYLPVREALWRKVVLRETPSGDQLFGVAVSVALAPGASVRTERWQALVREMFDPLELSPVSEPVDRPVVRDDGLELLLPPLAGTPALRVRFPWRGRRLIGPTHLRLATTLTDVMRRVEASREAYRQGVLEERRRIAQDLHDDVGARLLTAMHKPDLDETRRVLREAVGDIRTIVSGMAGRSMLLIDLLADLRHEVAGRLEAAGMRVTWDEPLDAVPAEAEVDYRVARNLTATQREIVSNIIRHARATAVDVRVRAGADSIELVFTDDGVGMPEAARAGNGLANMTRRMQEIGGRVVRPSAAAGTALGVVVPLQAQGQPA